MAGSGCGPALSIWTALRGCRSSAGGRGSRWILPGGPPERATTALRTPVLGAVVVSGPRGALAGVRVWPNSTRITRSGGFESSAEWVGCPCGRCDRRPNPRGVVAISTSLVATSRRSLTRYEPTSLTRRGSVGASGPAFGRGCIACATMWTGTPGVSPSVPFSVPIGPATRRGSAFPRQRRQPARRPRPGVSDRGRFVFSAGSALQLSVRCFGAAPMGGVRVGFRPRTHLGPNPLANGPRGWRTPGAASRKDPLNETVSSRSPRLAFRRALYGDSHAMIDRRSSVPPTEVAAPVASCPQLRETDRNGASSPVLVAGLLRVWQTAEGTARRIPSLHLPACRTARETAPARAIGSGSFRLTTAALQLSD